MTNGPAAAVLRPPIVVAVWLDRAPDWNALGARVDRISRLIPSLRQRVIDSPVPCVAPRWTYDPHFDLDWHMRRVRAPEQPRTREAVLEFARLSAMDAFDRARPLWELTLVEGVEDGGTALIVKVHHSLSDGVSGVRMPAVMADPKRKPRRFGAMPPAPPGETVDQLTPAAGAASRTAARRKPSPGHRRDRGALNMLPVGYVGGILKHVDFLDGR